MSLPKSSSVAVVAENMQRNESEPVLDQKNTRSAKHIEIRVNVDGGNGRNEGAAAVGESEGWRQRASTQRKDRQSKDRHGKDRSSGSSRTDEPKRRPPSGQYSEAGSTEYSYSETG